MKPIARIGPVWKRQVASRVCPYQESRGFGPRDTSPQHKTHKTDDLKVYYPWHPLFGQAVAVRMSRQWKGGAVVRCEGPTDVARGSLEVPAWMLDHARCSSMTLGQEPFVEIEALTELRDVLDRALRNGGNVLKNGHQLDTSQGGVDAQAIPQSGTTGVVPSPLGDPRLEDPARKGPGTSSAGACSDVPRPTGSNRRR